MVHLTPKLVADLPCGYGDADDDLFWLLLTQCPDCSHHCGASCESVINKNHCPASDLRRGTSAAVGLFATFQFTLFARFYQAHHFFRKTHSANKCLVEDTNTSGSNRAKGQFFFAGYAELSYH